MKKLFSLLMLGVASLTAQAEDATYHIIFERDTTVSFTLGDISLGSRDIHMVHYEYPSKDVEGNTVNISGSIWVPMNIYDGTDPCYIITSLTPKPSSNRQLKAKRCVTD